MPNAAKVKHVNNHPRVSLNLDSYGNGAGIIIVGGNARVDAEGADPLADERYVAKYGEYAASLGFTKEFLSAYNTRVKISIDKVWTTPTGG
jgi:PPOX class probable F420-dependent enzyme